MVEQKKSKSTADQKEIEHGKLVSLLLNPKKSVESRAKMLIHMFHAGTDPATMQAVVQNLLNEMAVLAPAVEVAALKEKYEQTLKELDAGPPRPATFIGKADGDMPGPAVRAHVVTPEGHVGFPFLRDGLKIETFRRGQTVYLDAKGATVLCGSRLLPRVGPEAKFLRQLPDSEQVEVSVRDEAVVLDAAGPLLDAIEAGQVARDDPVLICAHRQFAFDVIATEEDRRYRFIDRLKIPHVHPAQEIGAPHPILRWLARRTSILMFRQDLVTRFRARNRVSVLFEGPTGSGKTLTIKGYLTLFYELLKRRTGLENPDSRAVRVKLSDELSMYLGQSDKNFDRLFGDIAQLAAQPVETASGEKVLLPVVVILEEVEGIARRRSDGEYDGTGGVMDRILTTVLQRMDDPFDELANLPLIFVSTSNRPGMIDMAMFRRLGGKVAHFKRLNRRGLAEVLDKKIKHDLPLAAHNGEAHEDRRRQLIDCVVADLFSPAVDRPKIELTLRDGTKLTKYGRHFLTGAVVEQAVSDAIDETMFHAEATGQADVGLDSAVFLRTLHDQIDALAKNVTKYNAADYVDLPEHTQVANVQRFDRTGHAGQLLARPA